MTALGGSIACRSEEGEFTELELCFPPVEDAASQHSEVVSPNGEEAT
jgi:hypothetical protein